MNRFAPLLLGFAAMACTPSAPEQQTPAPVAATPLTIGVLEDRPGATTTEPARFVVRALFQKQGNAWTSLDPKCQDEACLTTGTASIPASIEWTVVQSGKPLGTITATTPKAWALYADVGTQELAAGAIPPTAGERTMDFSGAHDVALYRPLVTTSQVTASEPDGWKAGALAEPADAAVRKAFRAAFADVQNCATEGGSDLKPLTYADADIALGSTFMSANGWSVTTGQLSGYRCDGPLDETAFAPQTFAVSPTGEAKLLGEGLKLVDAGDYDQDGASELMFAVSAGNLGGYELHWGGFTGSLRYAFAYH